jgi:hypothetical protein
MKTRIRIALRALFVIALFVVSLPISSAAPPRPNSVVANSKDQERRERRHVKQGPEVSARVKQLEKFNKSVRSALANFEKNERRNGHKPKHDESFSLTLDSAAGPPSSAALKSARTASPFRKVSFKPQEPDYSEYGVEMIFIPTYSVPGEWQGTVIFTQFDPSGAYLGQYVANVAMVPDPTGTFWDAFYEVSYEDGEAYLQYGNPGFELGTPHDLQDPGSLQPLISAGRRPQFRKTSFTPQTPWQILRFGNNPRVRWVMKCTVIGSAGGAVGCGITSIFTGGATFGPCALGGVGASFTVCTLTAIFGS